MKTKQIRNGSLYFNEQNDRVERVLGKVNGQRVWTASHESQPVATKTKSIRLASSEEVGDYLGCGAV